MSKRARVKVTRTVYLTVEQDKRLKAISARTGQPVAYLIRKSIDAFIERKEESK